MKSIFFASIIFKIRSNEVYKNITLNKILKDIQTIHIAYILY